MNQKYMINKNFRSHGWNSTKIKALNIKINILIHFFKIVI
jgi:hypothetical protein